VARRGSPLTLAVDASVVVAALTGTDAVSAWAQSLLETEEMVAPHLMPAEVASMLRRGVYLGQLSPAAASLAHRNLLNLQVALVPYEPLAERVWALRANVTPYDGWYVALAESLEVSLATLDGPLTRAPGPLCKFVVPPVA
jgi:predicted nucleic acid-binding protein